MHYLVAGVLKPDSEEKLIALRDQWNEHLSQPNRKIALFGLLRDKEGRRAGYLAMIEAESFDDAENFLRQSPLYQEDLYDRVEVAEFTPEVGKLD
jgi:uncharacterized protein YciI